MEDTRVHVIVATEPTSYREVLAAVLKEIRPEVQVSVVDPNALDEAVLKHHPEIVLCSELTETVIAQVSTWVVLYPSGMRHTVIMEAGCSTTSDDLDFDQILAVIDRTVARRSWAGIERRSMRDRRAVPRGGQDRRRGTGR